MALQDVINDFQSILNRDDVTAAQAQLFVLQGMRRIQMDARLPNMERQLIITPNAAMNFFVVPPDLIQPIDIFSTDPQTGLWRTLIKQSYRQLQQYQLLPFPHYYARFQTQMWLAGPAQPGAPIRFLYYGNYSAFASLAADNELTASTPDLATYAGLKFAGDHVDHPSTPQWEATYQALLASAKQMAIDLDAEGGPQSMDSPYRFDDDSISYGGTWT